MKMNRFVVFALAAALLSVSAPVFAHHGASQYDTVHTKTLTATVTGFVWSNPHCILSFDSKDDKGVVTHWSVEMHNPTLLGRAGWTSKTLQPGDEIQVTFHAAKNGSGSGMLYGENTKISVHGTQLPLEIGEDVGAN
jgi:type 1 fimbria pilin